jgi:Histidine kinase-, DNA gyrase B-, and HSP90-like ATPase
MSTIKIGPAFFKNELRVYRDPILAFFRENVQNSVDAGSSRIDISLIGNGPITNVIFTDNGCGMTEDQLQNVYFVLGETSKTGPDSIGGFGKARILCLFSQDSYTIHTNNVLVTGSGADYSISYTDTHHKGVSLNINAYNNGVNFKDKLEYYLSKCQLDHKCDIYINGIKWNIWTRKNRVARTLSFGTVYTNKSKESELLIRVNGTLMYKQYTNASAQVILEIDQNKSRTVLQASRDGLMYPYDTELNAFISEITLDKRSALKEKKSRSVLYKGKGLFSAKKKQILDPNTTYYNYTNSNTSSTISSSLVNDNGISSIINATNKHTVESYLGDMDQFSIYLDDDTDNPAIRKVIDYYNPQKWKYEVVPSYSQNYNKNSSRKKLLLCWKVCCEKVIEILQNMMDGPDTINWAIGWTFSDNAKAKCASMDGAYYLLLNPCSSDGKMAYSITDKEDLYKIISLAIHEVCHIVCNYHDEDFAGNLTELFGHVLSYRNDIINAMKDAKDEFNNTVVS